MLRLDTGVYAVPVDDLIQLIVGQAVQRAAGNGLGGVSDDAQLSGDGHGGVLVVAGDHHRADACGAALGHGVLHLRPHGVDHTGKADEAQLLLQRLRRQILGQTVVPPFRRRQHPQRLVGHGLVVRQNGGTLFLRHGQHRAALRIVGAAAQHLVRRTLGVLDEAAVRAVDSGHHLPAGVKGRFGAAGLPGLQLGLGTAADRGKIHQRRLGRLALGAAVLQNGVVAQRHGGGQQRQRPRVLHHRHFVLGQGTGLVGADDLGAAQRLHCGEPPDHGVPLAHVGDADAQHHRHHRGQPLGYRRHRQRYRHHKGAQDGGQGIVSHYHQVENKDEHADGHHQLGQRGTQLGQLPLQRRLILFRLGQHAGDLAHLRVHAGGGDDGAAAAVDHGAAHVAHVFPVAQRHVLPCQQLRRLGGGHALAGESGLLDLQRDALQQPPIGGDGVSGLQHHHIPGHQLAVLHHGLVAVPQHLAFGGGHGLERLNGGLGLALLHHAEHGVQQHHGQDDEHLREALAAESIGDGADGCGGHQHQQHGILQLRQESAQQGGLLRLLQLVGAVRCQPRRCLRRRQAQRRGVQLLQYLLGRAVVVVDHTDPPLFAFPCLSRHKKRLIHRFSCV